MRKFIFLIGMFCALRGQLFTAQSCQKEYHTVGFHDYFFDEFDRQRTNYDSCLEELEKAEEFAKKECTYADLSTFEAWFKRLEHWSSCRYYQHVIVGSYETRTPFGLLVSLSSPAPAPTYPTNEEIKNRWSQVKSNIKQKIDNFKTTNSSLPYLDFRGPVAYRMHDAFAKFLGAKSLAELEAECQKLTMRGYTKKQRIELLENLCSYQGGTMGPALNKFKKHVKDTLLWNEKIAALDQALARGDYPAAQSLFTLISGLLLKQDFPSIAISLLYPEIEKQDAQLERLSRVALYKKMGKAAAVTAAGGVLVGVGLASAARAHRKYSDQELKTLQWYRRHPVALARRFGMYRYAATS